MAKAKREGGLKAWASSVMLGAGLIVAGLVGERLNAATAPAQLSLLTYNVEGLPWPVRFGRTEKLHQIGKTLAALRARGRQPHVIVLQEAFTPEAKAIATEAGYRYVADGPGARMAGAPATSAEDKSFAAGASLLIGEREGKWADSGLRIASDYPIVGVRRMPYPAFACAGLDCLANKGMLAVALRVPGFADPVVVVATHMNSRFAAKASPYRSLYAFRRQVDALGAFVRRVVPASAPFVLAGDLNVGEQMARRSYLIRDTASWRQAAPLGVAMEACLPDPACGKRNLADLRYSFHRSRDWQFYSPGARAGLRVASVSGLFGHDARGDMLSDHVGYVASYRLTGPGPAAPLTVAMR